MSVLHHDHVVVVWDGYVGGASEGDRENSRPVPPEVFKNKMRSPPLQTECLIKKREEEV